MISFQKLERPDTLERAWELYQKKGSCLLGGMHWIKMSSASYQTAIDLSGLGLNKIEETEDAFVIGCMTSLRQMEVHPGLEECFGGAVREALRHIVGVQFRNTATVGGSVAGRFGFSDVLSVLLSLNCSVELFKGGTISLQEYADAKPDRDILVHLIIHKEKGRFHYQSMRNAKTDFPVLTCAAALTGDGCWKFVYGARPQKAYLIGDPGNILDGLNKSSATEEEKATAAERFAQYAAGEVPTGSNMRGSAQYRTHLVKVLTKRAVLALAQE